MKRRKFLPALAASAAALIAATTLAACGGSTASGGAPGQLTAATLVDVQSFDPAINPGQGQRVYLDPVYDTLLRTDENGNVTPGVATEYKLTPQSLDLTLQEGREFSDGEPLDANAVQANLESRKSSAGPASVAFANVTDVEVVSPTEVTLSLSAPSPALPIALTDVAGMLVAPDALDAPDLGTNPVGSGPYVLDTDASQKGVKYVYTPNDTFTDKSQQTLDRIEIRVLTDDAARAAALRSGQVDLAQIGRSQVDAAKSSGIHIDTFPGNYWMLQFLDLDGTKAPALKNKKFRQAVCTAINSDQVVQTTLFGLGKSQSQVFPKGNQFHVDALDDVYKYNQDKARQLFAESGVTDTSFSVPTFGPLKSINEAIQGNLREVGIDMDITLVQPGTLDKENRETNFPAIVTPIKQVHPEQLFTDRLATDGPQNPFQVAHPEVDAAHERALEATDEAGRIAAYADMQTTVADNALWCGLFQDESVVGWNDKVKNVHDTVGWPMGPSFRGVTVS